MLGTVLHALTTLVAQLAGYYLLGDPLTGGLLGVAFWLGNEFAQAEYRAIGDGTRDDIGLLAGIEPRNWTKKAVLDVLLPALSVYIFWRLIA